MCLELISNYYSLAQLDAQAPALRGSVMRRRGPIQMGD
ncbi:hypothetical protein FHW67_002277 [Herbaspirillum sp. Sphag1AN]|nr:hypothetical protein [Herbaspirillum sp. Sphag1AN]MBB3246186.1 hypothetical protein [Herbaspirillum sp. Sphag64]